MSDRADAGHDKGPAYGGRQAPFPPPFYPPFYPPSFQAYGFYPPPFSPPDPGSYHEDFDRPFLEAQRAFFTWYREQLTRRTGADSADDPMRDAMNALLAAWLDAVRAFREQCDRALREQSELVTRYLDVLDKLLDRPDQKPH
jgi:hypothetical protein